MRGRRKLDTLLSPRGRAGLVALVVVAALAAIGPAGSARLDQSYGDPRGDSGPGSDITGVTVRHDGAGTIWLQVGLASPLPGNHYITVFIDADNSLSTGFRFEGTRGLDYYLFASRSFGSSLYRWNGSQWVRDTNGAFTADVSTPNVVSFRTTRAALGNTNGFTFRAISGSGDTGSGGFTDTFWDLTDFFGYSLAAVPSGGGLKITQVLRTPRVPYADDVYTMKFRVSRVGRKGSFYGNVGCKGSIAGARLKWLGSVDQGAASCGFQIPANAAGKTITGLMTVTEGKTTLSREFKAKIVRQPLRLIASKLVETVPLQPRAGALFGYKVPISLKKGLRDSRPAVPREMSRVTCEGRVGGRAITARESTAVAGAARCVWLIPAGSAGSTLAGTIRVESPQTASATGASLVHTFSRRVG